MIENKKYIIFDLENTKVDSLLLADLKAYGYKMAYLSKETQDDETPMNKEEALFDCLNQLFHYKGHRKPQVVVVTNKEETIVASKEMEMETIGYGLEGADYVVQADEGLRALLIDEAELQAIRSGAAMPKDGPTATYVKGKKGKGNGEKRTNAMAVAWKFLYPFLLFYFAVGILEGFSIIILDFLAKTSDFVRGLVLVVEESTDELSVFSEIGTALVQAVKYIGGFIVAYYALKGNKLIKKTQEEVKGFTTLNYISWTVLSLVLALGMNFLLTGLGMLEMDTNYVEAAESLYGVGILIGIILYGVVAPITEEIFFRGVIFNGLKEDLKPFSAAAISAALFGIYHGNVIQAVYGFALGLVLAYAYYYSKRIFAPMLMHSVVNIVVFLCTNFDVFKKGSAQTTIGVVCTVLGLLVLVYIVKTKEMNIGQENN